MVFSRSLPATSAEKLGGYYSMIDTGECAFSPRGSRLWRQHSALRVQPDPIIPTGRGILSKSEISRRHNWTLILLYDIYRIVHKQGVAMETGAYNLGDEWLCECGKSHVLSGLYLAAHWGLELVHVCDECGRRHIVKSGKIFLESGSKKRKGEGR